MKTKNAFAFRDFDKTKILSRNFFKNLSIDVNNIPSPSIIMDYADGGHEYDGTVEENENDLRILDETYSALVKYKAKIIRHKLRIEKIGNAITEKLLKTPSTDLDKLRHLQDFRDRARNLWEQYHNIILNIEGWEEEIGDRSGMLNSDIIRRYRYTFADRLKELRQLAGLTQKEVAYELGVSPNTIAGYENARREPDIVTIQRLIRILNVSANDLFETT